MVTILCSSAALGAGGDTAEKRSLVSPIAPAPGPGPGPLAADGTAAACAAAIGCMAAAACSTGTSRTEDVIDSSGAGPPCGGASIWIIIGPSNTGTRSKSPVRM